MAVRSENFTENWYYSREQIENSPSRKYGVDQEKELSYRQQAANLIQDMGQRLTVNQLCINTAIVYMHRFYMVHSFTKFHRNVIAPACLFLGAKVEEQPRKLEHVVRFAYACLNRESQQQLNPKTELYSQLAQELVINESIILQTLGFEIAVDHPHTHVVKCTQLIRASKDLSQTSYFMATNSLHLTTFCLRYKPTAVACACIHLSAKWSKMQIPKSSDGKNFWEYVDRNITVSVLDDITREFIKIIENSPNRLKRKLTLKAQAETDSKSKVNENASTSSSSTSIFDVDPGSSLQTDALMLGMSDHTDGKNMPPVAPSKSTLNLNEYKMMKEKEVKREKEKERSRIREAQKLEEQKHLNHKRLMEQEKHKESNSQMQNAAKHGESRSHEMQGHSSSNKAITDQVKHGDHKWSSLHTDNPEKVIDRSQGHGDARRTHDRPRSHHVQNPHAPPHSDKTHSVKPSSKDVRPPDHKKDIRNRHHHQEKRPNENHRHQRPVEEPRSHSDQRHRTDHRHPDGKVAIPKHKHLHEKPVDQKLPDFEQRETLSIQDKTKQDYILMKPESLVEMDILGALKEECSSPYIQSSQKPSPVPTAQLDYKAAIAKDSREWFKQERVPNHQSLIQESMQGISKKESATQPIVSKDRRKKSAEHLTEAKTSKGKPEVKVHPEQVHVKSEHTHVKSEHVPVKSEHVPVKSEHVPVKSEHVISKPDSPRIKKESVKMNMDPLQAEKAVKVRRDFQQESMLLKPEHSVPTMKSSPVKVKKEVNHESMKLKSEHHASPVKNRKGVLQSPNKAKKRVSSRPIKMAETSTLDLSSIGISSILTRTESSIGKELNREQSKTTPNPTTTKTKEVKKETAVKLDFNYSKPVLQKGKSEPVAPPKKRIKNMMQTQSQPSNFDAEHLSVPHHSSQHATQRTTQKVLPEQMLATTDMSKLDSTTTTHSIQQQKTQAFVQHVQQPSRQHKTESALPQKVTQHQAVHQQVPQPMSTSNPVEPWSDIIHPAEILDGSDFMNMKQDMSQLDDFSTGLLPGSLFDFPSSEVTNPVGMNDSSNILEQQLVALTPTVDTSYLTKDKAVKKSETRVKRKETSPVKQSNKQHASPVKQSKQKSIPKDVHPAEILDDIPVKKSKPVKKELASPTNQLDFDLHPAELLASVALQASSQPKEPSEDGELVGDDSLIHHTEIENPALLRVRNEELVTLKTSEPKERDHERRSSEHRRHSKHKHSSEKKKKDKDRDRHRSKDRSSSRSKEVHHSESKEHSNGTEAGPSVHDEQPTSVLTTSGGIKLKIKFGNSFDKQASPSAGSSPLSMKIDLKKIHSSKHDRDGKHEKERKKDKSSRHHKHKSHKRSHSPLESSAVDPPASPAKRRATNSSHHNSLLSLPMPPADPKKKSKHSLSNSNGDSPASNVYNFN
ncbi:uncharacterized protein [Antedon mediterranea]|uniref:uncharacterized protein n=1 Tax=Antedon mediterranea TaxID=105859 RepID=UPI003AF724C0